MKNISTSKVLDNALHYFSNSHTLDLVKSLIAIWNNEHEDLNISDLDISLCPWKAVEDLTCSELIASLNMEQVHVYIMEKFMDLVTKFGEERLIQLGRSLYSTSEFYSSVNSFIQTHNLGDIVEYLYGEEVRIEGDYYEFQEDDCSVIEYILSVVDITSRFYVQHIEGIGEEDIQVINVTW